MQVQLGEPVDDYYVVTSHSGTMLGRLLSTRMQRSLLITTPDRIDTITTAMAVHSAGVVPLAGVVITDHSGAPSLFLYCIFFATLGTRCPSSLQAHLLY